VKDEAEIEAITKALEQCNWNRKKAALILKISYKALLYKIRQYDIQRSGSVIH
jgi:DNA-binding NtrC family response regulator